jgi:hypothetical protein
MRSPAGSPPSSMPPPAASSRRRAPASDKHRQGIRRAQRHHRGPRPRTSSTPRGIAVGDRGLMQTPAGGLRVLPLQAEVPGGQPRRVRAPDRGLQGPRHRLLLLQRRRRFGGYLPEGIAAVRIDGLSAAGDSRAQDRRQRSAASRTTARASAPWPSTSPFPRARPPSTWRPCAPPRPRSSSSRSWDGTPAGSPRPARSSRTRGRSPVTHPVPGDRVRPGQVPGRGQGAGEALRLLRDRRLRGLPQAGRTLPGRAGHPRRLRPRAARRPCTLVANMIKDALGYKFHWAVADYLQRSARHLASSPTSSRPTPSARPRSRFAVAGKNASCPASCAPPASATAGASARRRSRRWPTSRR